MSYDDERGGDFGWLGEFIKTSILSLLSAVYIIIALKSAMQPKKKLRLDQHLLYFDQIDSNHQRFCVLDVYWFGLLSSRRSVLIRDLSFWNTATNFRQFAHYLKLFQKTHFNLFQTFGLRFCKFYSFHDLETIYNFLAQSNWTFRVKLNLREPFVFSTNYPNHTIEPPFNMDQY